MTRLNLIHQRSFAHRQLRLLWLLGEHIHRVRVYCLNPFNLKEFTLWRKKPAIFIKINYLFPTSTTPRAFSFFIRILYRISSYTARIDVRTPGSVLMSPVVVEDGESETHVLSFCDEKSGNSSQNRKI